MRNAVMEFLNNATVAAFSGAFAAFVLVTANDWRRRRRSKRQLKFLVSDNADLARAKHRTVRSSIEMLRKDRRIAPAPIMPFPVAAIRAKHLEIIDLLGSNENQGLGVLIYWMEAIDDVLENALTLAMRLQESAELDADNATRTHLAKRILSEWGDAARNLEHLQEMCEWYVAGHSHKILEMQHPSPSTEET